MKDIKSSEASGQEHRDIEIYFGIERFIFRETEIAIDYTRAIILK